MGCSLRTFILAMAFSANCLAAWANSRGLPSDFDSTFIVYRWASVSRSHSLRQRFLSYRVDALTLGLRNDCQLLM